MKYTVDEIIGNMVSLISFDGVKKDVSISVLPCDIKENDVVVFLNNRYIKDDALKKDREQTIRDKMAMLKKNND